MLGSSHQQGQRGFTIVELLIVVVVIAILAAISTVAYSSIQRRASNAAIVDAASKTYRLVQAYVAQNGNYPVSSTARICITNESGCSDGAQTPGNSSTFDNNMATIGTLPRKAPVVGTDYYGVMLYRGGQTLDGVARPLLLYYYLSGNNQTCGMTDNLVTYTWPDFTLSTTGNSGNVGDKTRCWISLPGPTA